MLEKIWLIGGVSPVKEQEGGSPFSHYSHLLQCGYISYFDLPPRPQDGFCSFGPNSRDTHQGLAFGQVNFNRTPGQVFLCPGKLRVGLDREPAVRFEWQLFQIEPIIA